MAEAFGIPCAHGDGQGVLAPEPDQWILRCNMATTLAEQIQNAIDRGASLDELRRHFHLSESELRDYCAGIMDDDPDDPSRSSGTGY